MESIFKNKKIILGIVLVIIAFIAYSILFVDGNKEDDGGFSRKPATSSIDGNIEDGPEKEFVAQLLAIRNITFKMSLFDDVVFKNMVPVDDTIQPQPQGRRNPFLPFEVVDGVVTKSTEELGQAVPTEQQTETISTSKVTAPKTKRTR